MYYYTIRVKPKTDRSPPYFTGSMLRGAFGYALKRVTCMNPSYRCEGCFATEKCLYYGFYEKQNIQHTYRLDIGLNQKNFDFSLYLFAKSCHALPYVLSSLEMALTQNGVGRERMTFEALQMEVNGVTVYRDHAFSSQIDSAPCHIDIGDYASDVKIKFLTPLRIKKGNKLTYDDITIEHILRSIYQRKQQIFDNEEVYSLDYEPTYITSVKIFEYKPLYRKSDRQGKKMVMGGVIGEMAVLGLDKKSYELLKIGEIIGVGKQTVFGLGKIEVEEIERK